MRIKSTLFCFVSILASTNYVFGTDIFVPTDYPTIQQALDAAVDGDHIYVHPGVYYENIGRSVTEMTISITGLAGASQTIIDGQHTGRAFYFLGNNSSTISLTGLTFRNGYFVGNYNLGAGVYVGNARLLMDACVIEKNYASALTYQGYGGGLFWINESSGSELEPSRITRTIITGNKVHSMANNYDSSGAGLFLDSNNPNQTDMIVESCIIAGNLATQTQNSTGGLIGEIYAEGMISFNSCKFDVEQRFYAYATGVHANNTIFCGDVDGSLAGTGNIYECNYMTNPGACCIEGECTDKQMEECIAFMGVFNGQFTSCADTACSPVDDPSGACCIAGMCAEMSQSNCEAISGTWGGDYLLCSQVNCEPPPPTAACCLGSTCTMVQEETCGEMGGNWWAGSNCKKAKCVALLGACCIEGSCLDVTLDECFSVSGSYAGDLTSCKNGIECNDSCLGDINNDGMVNVTDLLTLISVWGACP